MLQGVHVAVLQIRVLGPIEIDVAGQPVDLGGRAERVVLASLVLGLNHAVPTDHLLYAIWEGDVPATGHETLQSIVSRLRSRLGTESIRSIDHSYVLAAEPDAVDVIRFERLLDVASAALPTDPEEASDTARRALDLWRGEPFGDLAQEPFILPEVKRLRALRLTAVETRLEADIAMGRLSQASARLEAAVADHPYRERLWYLLMLALARDGRRVAALRTFQRLCGLLTDVGLEPSADIRELEEMILREDPYVRSHLGVSREASPRGSASPDLRP